MQLKTHPKQDFKQPSVHLPICTCHNYYITFKQTKLRHFCESGCSGDSDFCKFYDVRYCEQCGPIEGGCCRAAGLVTLLN